MPFTGKAADDSQVEIGEDLSPLVFELSETETPLLAFLGDSGIEATAQLHEWLEDGLNPSVTSLAANVASTAAAGQFQVVTSAHLKVGMIMELQGDGKTTHEQMLITSINGATTISAARAQAGTSATSHTSGDVGKLLGSAQLEGDDPSADVSTDRARLSNLTQIFEKNLEISGTKQAVNNVGIGNEVDHQKRQRVAELMREYEMSLIRGRKLVNTLVASGRRTMAGIIGSITQTQSLGTITSTGVDDLIRTTWDQGANADLILVNAGLKRTMNLFQGSQVRANQADRVFVRQMDVYEGFNGQQAIQMNRWMDPNKIAVGESERVRTVPLRGRSFFANTLGRTGDKTTVQVINEATNEFGTPNSWALGTNATA